MIIALEVTGGRLESALQAIRVAGIAIRQSWPLPNISKLLNNDFAVMDISGTMPETAERIRELPGVVTVEGSLEHAFYTPLATEGLPVNNLARNMPLGNVALTLGPKVDRQQAQQNLSSILTTIGAKEAWRFNQGEGAVICILDTGISSRVVPPQARAGGWADNPRDDPWTDKYGHGSMVASITLAVAPRVKIFSVKPHVGPAGGITSTGMLKALDFLLGATPSGTKAVVNNSWGIFGCPGDAPTPLPIPARLSNAIEATGGALSVWAAGNNADTCDAGIW